MNDTEKHKSRWTVLTEIKTELRRVANNQERLEKHMMRLAKANERTRQMSEEDRAAAAAQFQLVGSGSHRAQEGSGQSGAALAVGDLDAGYGRAGFTSAIFGHTRKSLL